MTRYKNVNGDVVAYTAEEEAEADILVSDAKVKERAEENLRVQRNMKAFMDEVAPIVNGEE